MTCTLFYRNDHKMGLLVVAHFLCKGSNGRHSKGPHTRLMNHLAISMTVISLFRGSRTNVGVLRLKLKFPKKNVVVEVDTGRSGNSSNHNIGLHSDEFQSLQFTLATKETVQSKGTIKMNLLIGVKWRSRVWRGSIPCSRPGARWRICLWRCISWRLRLYGWPEGIVDSTCMHETSS